MKKFIYGIAAVVFGDFTIGYIERNSWDWGGTKPESTDIDAEQVPDAPVLTLITKLGQIAPTFNIIQLDYPNLQKVLGGDLVKEGETVTGWNAPTSLVELRGAWQIKFVSGQKMTIPNGMILANLGGKLTLTEVSKLECQLKVSKPDDGGSPYGIEDMSEEELTKLKSQLSGENSGENS